MLRKCLLTALFVLMLSPMVAAEVFVTTEWDGLLCGQLNPGREFTCDILISNPDTISIDSMVLVFTMKKPESGYLGYLGHTFNNDYLSFFAGTEFLEIDEDSLFRFVLHSIDFEGYPAPGLPSSSDTVSYLTLTFESPGGQGAVACFDSSGTSEWQWDFRSTQTATWSGQECFEVHEGIPNCCFVVFLWWWHSASSWSWNQPLQYWFMADDMAGGFPRYTQLAGPGEVNWYNGKWTFDPTEEDAGLVDTVIVQAWDDFCMDGSYMRNAGIDAVCTLLVNVGSNGPPQFPSGRPHFVCSTGDTAGMTLDLKDGNPCNGCVWSYWISPQDVLPPGNFDSTTGTFYYTGGPADTGTYGMTIIVDQNGYGDTSGFYIDHFDSYICGNINHRGPIDIADLVWLVDFMFSGGPSPITLLAADVNCDSNVDISDLVYVVNWMFQSGPAPCEACP